MTTGRINQITLCRLFKRSRRAPRNAPEEADPSTVRFYAHRETSSALVKEQKVSHAVLNSSLFYERAEATHAKVSPVVSNRTVARRLDNFCVAPMLPRF